MRALKIAAVVVALLFIFTIFQNSYSTAMAQAKKEESETESALPEIKNGEQSSISEPISSVPGPPASDPTLASTSNPISDPASNSNSTFASAPTSASVSASAPTSTPISVPTSTPISAPAPVPISALEAPEALEERSITEPREVFTIGGFIVGGIIGLILDFIVGGIILMLLGGGFAIPCAIIGAIIGSIFGPIGTVIGFIVGGIIGLILDGIIGGIILILAGGGVAIPCAFIGAIIGFIIDVVIIIIAIILGIIGLIMFIAAIILGIIFLGIIGGIIGAIIFIVFVILPVVFVFSVPLLMLFVTVICFFILMMLFMAPFFIIAAIIISPIILILSPFLFCLLFCAVVVLFLLLAIGCVVLIPLLPIMIPLLIVIVLIALLLSPVIAVVVIILLSFFIFLIALTLPPLMVVALFVLIFLSAFMMPLFIIIALIALPLSLLLVIAFVAIIPLSIYMMILFFIFIPLTALISLPFFLPVIIASFADVSTFDIPASIQQILKDIGSKGTITEILFAYFKNLWSIVLNLPEIARLTANLITEDYAHLIKSFGSFILEWPANLRALPDKILRNLFPTVNALPEWLRQSPILLHVFPLLMYAPVMCCLSLLPVGPQAVKSYPAVFQLLLSLAENSIAIPVGCAALPVSTLISVFRGLPESLRAVRYHAADFISTLFLFPMRALPLLGTFIVLAVLWLLGAVLAVIFSPLLLIAPVFIILAMFVEGLKDKGDKIKAISNEGIKASIDNLPESVGEVDIVIERIAEMLGNAATTDISGLLDSLLSVNWLIVTQNLPHTLPEAMQSIGSAIPAIVNSWPDIIQILIASGTNLIIAFAQDILNVCTTLLKDVFAVIWVMPEFAVLIPQLLEILSVLTINLPALIKGFIPAAVDAVEQTTISIPELLPSIALSTMGLNSIVLQFAKAIWDMSANIVRMIIEFLWSLILFLPTTIFGFDECVTPWFGPRLLSLVGACIGSIPAGIIGCISGLWSLLIAMLLIIGMACYLPAMIALQCVSSFLELLGFCCTPITSCFQIVGSIVTCITTFTGFLAAIATIMNMIITEINFCIAILGVLIPIIPVLAEVCVALVPELAQIVIAIADFLVAVLNIIVEVLSTIVLVLGIIVEFIGIVISVITDVICYPLLTCHDLCTALILEPIKACFGLISSLITAISLLTEWLLPLFFLILVVLALFPLIFIVVAFLVLAAIYFVLYVFQIFIGTLFMALSGGFQSVVCVPLMSLCEGVPVVSTILGYCSQIFSFYACCIPPNFIEIITQLIPLGVNILASCPAIIFMPISLVQTFIGTASKAVEKLPSVPAYLVTLIDRMIFSFVAWIFAVISLFIDLAVAMFLSYFAISTGILGEILSLSILTDAPQIAALVLALIFVIFAWIIDLCGVLCLRTPDMINEYAYSILKSMAMMPVLSAIIPDMAAAPAAMQPEVVSEGLSKIAIIMILFLPAIFGAFVALVYNLLKGVVLWCYNTCPALVTLPCRFPTVVLNGLNDICSGIGSVIEGAAGYGESQLIPY